MHALELSFLGDCFMLYHAKAESESCTSVFGSVEECKGLVGRSGWLEVERTITTAESVIGMRTSRRLSWISLSSSVFGALYWCTSQNAFQK